MALLIRVITICKHVKVFHGFSHVGDLYYRAISLTIQSMGQTPLSQSIEIENPAKLFFSNVNLVWKDEFRHKGQNKVTIETTYIPHVCVSKFLENEQRDMQTPIEQNIQKHLPLQQNVQKLMINNHLGCTWDGLGID
jgi:hypothetical protein